MPRSRAEPRQAALPPRPTTGAAEPLSYSIVKERPSDARRPFLTILPKPPTDRHTCYRAHVRSPVGQSRSAEFFDHTGTVRCIDSGARVTPIAKELARPSNARHPLLVILPKPLTERHTCSHTKMFGPRSGNPRSAEFFDHTRTQPPLEHAETSE